MLRQRIICMGHNTIRSLTKWYGQRAIDLMFDVSDIIRPFMQTTKIHPNYEVYYVRQYNSGDDVGTDRRILTNLIPDCPIFYPIHKSEYRYIGKDGFLRERLPRQDIQLATEIISREPSFAYVRMVPQAWENNAQRVASQKILDRQTLFDSIRVRTFGAAALDLVQRLDAIVQRRFGVRKWGIGTYQPYVMRQFTDEGLIYYEGIALSCLIEGMPTIYPQSAKPFPANDSGGFQSITLPDEIRKQIRSLNYQGVNLVPRY